MAWSTGTSSQASAQKPPYFRDPDRVVPEEEPEISELLKEGNADSEWKYTQALRLLKPNKKAQLKRLSQKTAKTAANRSSRAEAVMIATGRVSNADILKPEKTGVELDEHKFIKVNEFLETSKKNIWAFGDAIGIQMFKHVANYEAGVVWHNAIHDHKVKMDFSAAPHAVFSHPQVASVGLTEEQAKEQIPQDSRRNKPLTVKQPWVQPWDFLKAS